MQKFRLHQLNGLAIGCWLYQPKVSLLAICHVTNYGINQMGKLSAKKSELCIGSAIYISVYILIIGVSAKFHVGAPLFEMCVF